MTTEGTGARFERLRDLVRALRAPDGCPWDREQTHASLRRFVLEEAYEVVDAIDHGTSADLRDELGDYLFEAVLLAQISGEQGDFTIDDAIDAVCDKLVRRHPHVFARQEGDPPLTSEDVAERWAAQKARERAAAGETAPVRRSPLAGVSPALPALLRAHDVSRRAAAVGFDWARAKDVLDKIEEEVAELRREVEAGLSDRAEAEMGDLLFAIANLSRKLGVEPESALRRATGTFIRRFDAMAEELETAGRPLQEATLDEMEAAWQRVKRRA